LNVVPCEPPGIGAKKVQESSETNFGITYRADSVALKSGVVDLHICTIFSINRSALDACPPRRIGAKKVQESSETSFELLT
jgi:hypothetical protein